MTVREGLSLRRNFSWVLFGNLVYMGTQGGILIILARLGSPEIVGRFSLALAICTPVFLFANLKLRDVLASDVLARFKFNDYINLRVLSSAVAALLTVAVAMFPKYSFDTKATIIAMCFAKVVESVSDVVHGKFQSSERMDYIGKSIALKGLLSLLVLAVAMELTHSLSTSVFCMGLAWLAVLYGYDVANFKRMTDRGLVVSWSMLKKPQLTRSADLATIAIPLGFTSFLVSLGANVPNYFIEHYRGESELGIYAALAYPVVAGNVLMNALMQALLPRIAAYWHQGRARDLDRLIVKGTLIGVAVGAVGVLGAIVLGGPFLMLLFGKTYADHLALFVWLMVAAALGYVGWVLNGALTAQRRYRVQAVVQCGVLALTVALCPAFDIRYGMLGAAWAAAIVLALRLCALLVLFRSSSARLGHASIAA